MFYDWHWLHDWLCPIAQFYLKVCSNRSSDVLYESFHLFPLPLPYRVSNQRGQSTPFYCSLKVSLVCPYIPLLISRSLFCYIGSLQLNFGVNKFISDRIVREERNGEKKTETNLSLPTFPFSGSEFRLQTAVYVYVLWNKILFGWEWRGESSSLAIIVGRDS